MTKKVTTYILFLLIPFLSFSQWEKLGNDIIGDDGDKIGTINSMALDASGEILVVGSPFNSDNGAFSGIAKVYDWDGSDWLLRSIFEGALPETEGTGHAVALSADGNTLALGISYGRNSLGYRCGIVNVMDWDGTDWIQRGATIEGEGNASPLFETDVFGSALSLSADGNFLIVGAQGNTPEVGVLQISGHARVYEWDGSQWAQMGEDIDGEISLEVFGSSVSINDAGNVVAIGGRDRNLLAADGTVDLQSVGYVRVLEWDGANWNPRGDTFFGTELGEKLGACVSLSSNGNTLCIGAPQTNNPGYAKVFDWNGSNWVQRGQSLVGANSAQAGSAVDLSSDGNIVAVGEPWANSVYGQAKVFEWKENNWEQVDDAIADAGPGNGINSVGSSVILSADGSVVAVGASGFDISSFSQNGLVNIFQNKTLVNIDDLDVNEIRIFPNPTNHRVMIQSSEWIEKVEVYTLSGQSVYSVITGSKEVELQISDLPTGTYLVKILSLDEIQTIKIVKL